MAARRSLPLPKGWRKHVKSGVLHAAALARAAVGVAWAHQASSRRKQMRLGVALDRANAEISLLREELGIKDSRVGRVPSRRRPHYGPTQRMRILQLKAARGWTTAQAARAFFVSEETMASWMRRVDEEGEHALIQIAEPVNRFPDFVRLLVRQLKVLCPAMGKVRSLRFSRGLVYISA